VSVTLNAVVFTIALAVLIGRLLGRRETVGPTFRARTVARPIALVTAHGPVADPVARRLREPGDPGAGPVDPVS
jgi:hypothetical protein